MKLIEGGARSALSAGGTDASGGGRVGETNRASPSRTGRVNRPYLTLAKSATRRWLR